MRTQRDPREFVRWFLDRELEGGIGIGLTNAQMLLARAVMCFEAGRTREALDAANRVASLDPQLRRDALIVARMCVRREVELLRFDT